MKFLIKHFEEIAGGLLLVGMALITLFNVLSRYLMGNPLSWAEEVATYLFVWMVMFGAAMALKTREHFVIEFFVDRFSGSRRGMTRVCVAALVVLACGIIFVNGLIYLSWGWNAVTPATEMSRAIPYSAVAIGGGLMLIRSVGLLMHEVASLKTEGDA